MSNREVLSVRSISKGYEDIAFFPWLVREALKRPPQPKRNVLRDLSLSIQQGEVVAVMAQNGEGKSTLLKLCVGALDPDRGKISQLGRSVTDIRSRQLRVWSPDHQIVEGRLTPSENVLHVAGLYSFDPQQVNDAAIQVLKALLPDIDHNETWNEKLVRNNSKGQKTVINYALISGLEQVARQVFDEPTLLVLDELESGLDPVRRNKIWQLLQESGAAGSTVVVVTHTISTAQQFCTRAIFIRHGGIYLDSAPTTIGETFLGQHPRAEQLGAKRDWLPEQIFGFLAEKGNELDAIETPA